MYATTMNDCGIDKAVLSPKDGGGLLISALDEDGMVAVYHEINDSNTVSAQMGISSIKPFVKKMQLLDFSDPVVVKDEFVELDDITYTKNVVMKQGRRSVAHTFSNPEKIQVPINKHPSMITDIIKLTYDETNKLKKAITTFAPSDITLKADGTKLVITFKDDNNDVFVDTIMDCDKYIDFSWKTDKFTKLLNNVNDKDTGSSFGITDVGLMYFVINDIAFMLAPLPA